MKKTIYNMLSVKTLLSLLVAPLFLVGCYDDLDDPNTSDYAQELQTKVEFHAPNITIGEIKNKYCSNNGAVGLPAGWTNDSLHFSRNSSNWETRITDDLVFEGVICANDGQFGCLYQLLLVRSIDEATNTDQAIDVMVKYTCLYPYYPVGQRVRINLKGLYVGAYSRSPRIGYPYWTSSGNHNLGPIPMEIFRNHIQLIGEPDPTVPECKCVDRTGAEGDAWLRATENRKTVTYYPTIATVQGVFVEADGKATLAVDSLEDAGYGVNRTLKLSNNSTMLVRTSTGNEVSHIVMPVGATVQLSGWFGYDSYDDKWQINLRDTSDFKIIHQ